MEHVVLESIVPLIHTYPLSLTPPCPQVCSFYWSPPPCWHITPPLLLIYLPCALGCLLWWRQGNIVVSPTGAGVWMLRVPMRRVTDPTISLSISTSPSPFSIFTIFPLYLLHLFFLSSKLTPNLSSLLLFVSLDVPDTLLSLYLHVSTCHFGASTYWTSLWTAFPIS